MTATCPSCDGTGKARAMYLRPWIKRLFRAEEREHIVHDDVREIVCPTCQGKGTVDDAKR
jgi:RecJ-like exonuclease